ncbi:ribulose-phosphate 3-epimerase [Aminivibrio sp.]|uniref:ribulose-phosphate 3-epimerase n=1 Tax=Aminivibrio sp. TaxID=1872489 RepID=UPI001A4326BF|nr:ribulose-phosphate 3-epimerase [Aminivibrio sp.]MBL3539681.1 ribulose-phosphate 3-epimerase [Aminivibrio sp.]
MMREVLFAPSLLSADILDVRSSIAALRGEHDWLHVDVMDGVFVPNITFGPGFVSALRKRYPVEVLDVHLMVEHPDRLIDSFLDAGSDYLTVHLEADRHIHRTLTMIRERGARAGVSINPGTPEELLRPVLPLADLVLVMSVNPGFGGQSFIPSALEKTKSLCRWREASHYNYRVEMDGGIGWGNAAEIALAGCDVIVMGSAVFGAQDPALFLQEIKLNVKEAIAHA